MKHVLVKLTIFTSLVVSAAHADIAPLIVGGTKAKKGDFPYIVSLHDKQGHLCGGSLIKKNWVLTAGHCVDGLKVSKVYIGLMDQKKLAEATEVMAVKKVVSHPRYAEGYDFALIQLKKNSKVKPVELNVDEITISDKAGEEIMSTTAGWGYTKANTVMAAEPTALMKVHVPLVPAETCALAYPEQINEAMICAGFKDGKKDACSGDSGGPLIVRDGTKIKLVGVVSWGEGCARPEKYGVYSKVNQVTDWIAHTTK